MALLFRLKVFKIIDIMLLSVDVSDVSFLVNSLEFSEKAPTFLLFK